MVPGSADAIPASFWNSAAKIIDVAGLSTPVPSAAYINAQPAKAPLTSWQSVMQAPAQPLNTKLGSAVMYGMSGPITPTPPPQQAAISQEFIGQCPMVLFNKELSIRAGSCNQTLGSWVDPSPLNVRSVMRWRPLPAGGLSFGVDSAVSGEGSATFAEITQQMTLTGYNFVMKNCLGITRWSLEENVYKVDSMGKVSSTLELHDVAMNSVAFFLKYIIRNAAGMTAAESTLFRMGQNQVNFTEWKNGENTGRLLATANRQGTWTKKGWQACMSPTSPRGWTISYPGDQKHHESPATVQDIRVAIAGSITLMAFRDEVRGDNGLNTQGSATELMTFFCGIALVVLGVILVTNFCMVFRASGIREKVKKTMFDTEGALLPKRPLTHRNAPLHPCY